MATLSSILRDLWRQLAAEVEPVGCMDGGVAPSSTWALPDDAAAYLREDNPRLLELRERYGAGVASDITHSLWVGDYVRSALDLQSFRSDNAYVWQQRGTAGGADVLEEVRYLMTAYYLQGRDPLNLFDVLDEDGAFGARTFSFAGDKKISRDLIDTINELSFLERVLQISGKPGLKLLDIGAGYGRFATRASLALANLEQILCVDAVPESTFLSEYYVQFRGAGDRCTIVPLYDIERVLGGAGIDIAVNIHSFSECTLTSISWWVRLARASGIRHLFVVPNAEDHRGQRLLSREVEGPKRDFLPVIEDAGYRLVVREPKYLDPSVQTHGVFPTHYYLFESV